MPDQFQDVDFTCDSLDVSYVDDLVLLQYFDRHFLPCGDVGCQLDLAERALAQGLL